MLRVIILLKDDVRRIETIVFQGLLELILQNLEIEAIHPTINLASKANSLPQVIQPHIMREPPPNFRVPSTHLSLRPSPALLHAHLHPSDSKQLILDSSDHMAFFQSSIVQSL